MHDLALINARVLTCVGDAAPFDDGFVAIRADRIAAIGAMAEFDAVSARDVFDCDDGLLTPGLIDCHTHLVYAGDRAREFEMRLQGASYEDIAQAGGGINATVQATRAADDDSLFIQSAARARRLLGEGVTTIEIKSGYGLDVDTERRQLRVARRIGRELPLDVRTTCLAAHAVPPEFAGRADDYIDAIVTDILPAVAREQLVDAVDAFCDRIGFTPAQTRRVFDAARKLGLPVKLHAEQWSDQGGCQLAAAYGALSCDHLEYASADGVAALARAGTVAVLLPGAFYFLRETKLPPIELLRRAAVPMAVATDSNPGSSPTTSLLLMLNMACTLFRLTPAEAIAGVTRNAARALGLQATHGTLEVGKVADVALWEAGSPAALAYEIGAPPPRAVFKRGVRVAPAA